MKIQNQAELRPSAQFSEWVTEDPHKRPRRLSRRQILAFGFGIAGATTLAVQYRDDVFAKRFAEIIPGQLYRGAWQRPWPIERLVDQYQIKSVLSLSIMGTQDEKYTSYASVARSRNLDWVLMPVIGSFMTLAQMAEAADFVEYLPKPLLFHCVAGHHRTTQAHTAWRMRHQGWSAEKAWSEVSQYRWTNPTGDVKDKSLVDRFAKSSYTNKETGYAPMAYDALGGPDHPRIVGHFSGQLLGMAARS